MKLPHVSAYNTMIGRLGSMTDSSSLTEAMKDPVYHVSEVTQGSWKRVAFFGWARLKASTENGVL